ncbi:uncharacterized protein ACNLHF_019345 [Anomaloglossus baeobatrachus]
MDMDRDKMAERILHLTLEILFRLTGEDYTVVKKTSSEQCPDPVSEGWGRPLSPITGPPPHFPIHEDINDQKILELTYKMIELLTGEVPIRCQDVTVYFSMEEWEYLEGHKDLYKDVMMEVPQPLTSPDNCTRRLEVQLTSSIFKSDDIELTQDKTEANAITTDIPSSFHSKDLSSDSFKQVLPSDLSQTIKNKKTGILNRNAFTSKNPFLTSEYEKIHKKIHTGDKIFSSASIIYQRTHTENAHRG